MAKNKKKLPTKNQVSRRSFMKKAATLSSAVAFPNIITGCTTTGGVRRSAPSERVTLGVIGCGWQGIENTSSFLFLDDVQVVAVCDIDAGHLEDGQNLVNGHYANFDCQTHHYFEEICQREDIDTMLIALPDHWHAVPAITAANAGKHVFGEKPLSHKLTEGRAMVNAVEDNGVIWQTGSWQRSVSNFHQAAELVRNGRIGRVHRIECGLTSGHEDYEGTGHQKAFSTPPEGIDYERWLGPSGSPQELPYAPARIHKNWRWVMDHGGGALMDWVGHHVDIAHWGMGYDKTGPVQVSGAGIIPAKGELWDSPTEYDCLATYADGVQMHISSEHESGTRWIGEDGWLEVSRGNHIESNVRGIFEEDRSNFDIKLTKSDNHWRNFIDSVRSGKEAIASCETAHRSASVGHLCNIAMYSGRTIDWDPNTEEIIGDAEASEMLSPNYHGEWEL
jgi:predicted dehydrogenase